MDVVTASQLQDCFTPEDDVWFPDLTKNSLAVPGLFGLGAPIRAFGLYRCPIPK